MLYLVFFIILSTLFVLLPFKNIDIKIVKVKKFIFPALIIMFLIFMVIFSESSYQSAHRGFMLWANNVFPSLLPFFICIELLKSTNFMESLGKLLEPIMRPIFRVPGCGAFAIVMGISSGYPVGAKIVSGLREANACSKTEGERLLAFTNTSGPLFIIGSVGAGMFSDNKIGILLFITHFISSILVGILFRFYHFNDIIISHNPYKANRKASFKISLIGELMSSAIKNSISTLLIICGYMIFFSVLSNILIVTNFSKYISIVISYILNLIGYSTVTEIGLPIFNGILEVTGGVSELSKMINIKFPELLSIVAFVLGFGGISICMQVNSIIANTDLSLKPYIIGKFLQGVFASFFTYFLVSYTNFLEWKSLETIKYSNYSFNDGNNMLIFSVASLILICIIINQILKYIKKEPSR